MKSLLSAIFLLLIISCVVRLVSVKHSDGAYQLSIKDGSNCSCDAKPMPKIIKKEIPAEKKYDKAEIF